MDALVTDVFQQISADVGYAPYAFFGHSLGALICYELVERIKADGLPGPEHIFFSGKTVPHVQSALKRNYHLLDAEEFKEAVINLGGTPPEFFDYPELAELFLPLLRSDFKMAETFVFTGEVCRYDGNITVFVGKEEEGTPAQYHGWKDYTSKLCSLVYFNGGHFFLHNEMESMANVINQTLLAERYVASDKMNLSRRS
jgi:surfactin synthase thioesterase subunit